MFNSMFRATLAALVCALQLSSINPVMAFGPHGACGSIGPTGDKAQKINDAINARIRSQGRAGTAAAPIQVYFHVMVNPDDSRGNISEYEVAQQINMLNENYGDTGISFKVADIDYAYDSTYFNSPYPGTSAHENMFTNYRKGGSRDLNFFTASLDSPPEGQEALLGFAAFPWDYDENPTVDGVVISYKALPNGELEKLNTGKIGTHEVGHWVGLYHTFDGGCEEPGDAVSDTPSQAKPNTGCPTDQPDSCLLPGKDHIHNHMDYTDDTCRRQFTDGQVERFRGALEQYRGVTF